MFRFQENDRSCSLCSSYCVLSLIDRIFPIQIPYGLLWFSIYGFLCSVLVLNPQPKQKKNTAVKRLRQLSWQRAGRSEAQGFKEPSIERLRRGVGNPQHPQQLFS